MRILVVDDVGYTRHYHARLLEKMGHSVESAASGNQALKILERDFSIDIVLTDLMMRELDGVDLFKSSLKINRVTDNGCAEPPIFILMTALRPGGAGNQQRDMEKLRMAKDIGFLDVLYKPIDPEHLRKTIETVNFARGKQEIDLVGVMRRVEETVDKIASNQDEMTGAKFLSELQAQMERLEKSLAAFSH